MRTRCNCFTDLVGSTVLLKYGINQGPTNISQVLSPFSASPPAVLLSGFRSRCHIVIKGAFPAFRVQQGLTQLIHLYTRAGFPKEELQTISDQLLIQHQNLPSQCQTRASCWLSACCCVVAWVLSSFLLCLLLLLSCGLSFVCFVLWQLLGSTFACSFFSLGQSLRWIMLKVVLSITIWLGL